MANAFFRSASTNCISGLAVLALAAVLWLPAANQAVAGPALLFDASTSKVLYAEDPDKLWHPASLTKLMTAYLTFQAIKAGRIKMSDRVVQSANSGKNPASKIGLPVGAGMTLETALKALIIKSANDVAVMIAEKVGGSEKAFVQQMNETARRLGMTRTEFHNPNGLPHSRQVTTARDMALLARAIILQFPEHALLFTQDKMRIGKKRLRSHNALLRTYDGADGMKTGFICASGFNVVASASKFGQRIVAVVLGADTAPNRTRRARKLLDYGFKTSGWRSLFMTATIDNMPLDPAARGKPVNFRRYSKVWSCGYRPKKKKGQSAELKGTTAVTELKPKPLKRTLASSAFRQSER